MGILHEVLCISVIVSQPALAWLKVRYYSEVLVCSRTFDVEKHLSLSFPYMTICWLLVEFRIMEGGGGNWPRFPTDFSGHVLENLFLVFAWWRSLVRLADRCGRLQLRVPVGGKQTSWVCTGKRLFWLGDFKFNFGWRTPHGTSPIHRRTDVGNRRVG
jgi:hypothetical protein